MTTPTTRIFESIQGDDTIITFKRELAQETFLGERKRAVALATIYTVALVIMLLSSVLVPDTFRDLASEQFPMQGITLLLLVAMIYELMIWAVFGLLIKRMVTPHPALRYLNTLVETLFPTIAVALIAQAYNPNEGLRGPVILVYFPLIALAALRLEYMQCLFAGIVSAVGYWVVAALVPSPAHLPSPSNILRGVLILAMGGVAAFAAIQIRRSILDALQTMGERNRLVGIFGQHVSPKIFQRIIQQRSTPIEAQETEVCVLLVGIHDFATFVAPRDQDAIVKHLDKVFNLMIDILEQESGVIFKFLGTGFMAVFAAPFTRGDIKRHAVTAGMEIIKQINSRCEAGTLPQTRIGMAIHAGKAKLESVETAIGPEYRIEGRVVNFVNRIESYNQKFRSQVLISAPVWMSVKESYPKAVAISPVYDDDKEERVGLYWLA